MPSLIPFREVDRRTLWLRVTLLTACFLGLIASAPLWSNQHTFPLLLIFPRFPILPAPLDKILFGVMLTSLVAAIWFYRVAVWIFLAASFFAYCEDENRGQPWFYMYWVMLLLTQFRPPSALAACRIGMSAVYIWCGIQKCNARFFNVTPSWFIEPATHWHLPAFAVEAMKCGVFCAPFIELAIGVALWFPKLRRLTIWAALALHVIALIFLGPLGHNYNWVVWPWNLAMPALLWVLFTKGFEAKSRNVPIEKPSGKKTKTYVRSTDSLGLGQTFAQLTQSKTALCLVALYCLLPILSYYGRWDSYFSFSLYSENSATANVFVSEAFRDRLPAKMQAQIQKFPQRYDPQRQGPFVFNYAGWGFEELHVPPIAEPRNFRSVFKALQTWSKEPGDVRMIIGQRYGPVIFCEGESVEYLRPQ